MAASTAQVALLTVIGGPVARVDRDRGVHQRHAGGVLAGDVGRVGNELLEIVGVHVGRLHLDLLLLPIAAVLVERHVNQRRRVSILRAKKLNVSGVVSGHGDPSARFL